MKLPKPQPDRALLPRAAEAAAAKIEQAEKRFDPEIEITENERKKMLQLIQDHYREQNWLDFIELSADYIMLYPQRRHELSLDINIWEQMQTVLTLNRGANIINYLSVAAQLVILFPERRSELIPSNEIWDHAQHYIATCQGKGWQSGIEGAFNLNILFPDRREALMLDDEAWSGANEVVEFSTAVNAVVDAARTLMHLVVLFPHRKQELDIEANEKIIRDNMEQCRNSRWPDFHNLLRDALYLKIITTDEVRITDHGLELINHDRLEQDTALPTRNIAA